MLGAVIHSLMILRFLKDQMEIIGPIGSARMLMHMARSSGGGFTREEAREEEEEVVMVEEVAEIKLVTQGGADSSKG